VTQQTSVAGLQVVDPQLTDVVVPPGPASGGLRPPSPPTAPLDPELDPPELDAPELEPPELDAAPLEEPVPDDDAPPSPESVTLVSPSLPHAHAVSPAATVPQTKSQAWIRMVPPPRHSHSNVQPVRFTFFGGKGGVGKTTCAAAASVRAAAEGERVVVISTDPAHSLGDALRAKLGRDPTRIADARGELFAVQLDADRALTRWVDEREEAFRTIAERGTYLDEEDVQKLLSLSLPGVDELVGLLELRRLSDARAWDRVVIDTAPTGHTLRLLEMPDTLRRFAEVLDDMHAKHRFLASSLGGRWRPDFADDVIAEVERDAKGLRELLVDPSRATFTWITLLEELPLDESEDGVRAIEEIGVRVDTIVANRTWPPPDRRCSLCTPRVEDESRARTRLFRMFRAKSLLEVPAALDEPRGPAALLDVAYTVRELAR